MRMHVAYVMRDTGSTTYVPNNPTAMELRRANVDGTVGPPS